MFKCFVVRVGFPGQPATLGVDSARHAETVEAGQLVCVCRVYVCVSSSLAMQRRACAAISTFLCFVRVQFEAACRAYCNAGETIEISNTAIRCCCCVYMRIVFATVFCFGKNCWSSTTIKLNETIFSVFSVFIFKLVECFLFGEEKKKRKNKWKFFLLLSVDLSIETTVMCPFGKKWEIWVQIW